MPTAMLTYALCSCNSPSIAFTALHLVRDGHDVGLQQAERR
jgi:hypothetical protein